MREKTRPQRVTGISLWFHVTSKWLLLDGEFQNEIKLLTVFGFVPSIFPFVRSRHCNPVLPKVRISLSIKSMN